VENTANTAPWLTRSRIFDIQLYCILTGVMIGSRRLSASCVVALPSKAIFLFVERLVQTKRRAKDLSCWRSPMAMSRSPVVSASTFCVVPLMINGHLVADQFKASWRHAGKVCPPVKAVYKIIGSQSSLAKYDAYRSVDSTHQHFSPLTQSYRTNVEARGNFMASGRSAGNENRRWHGTRRKYCFSLFLVLG
jgi:hypothetical protein